MMKCFSRFEIWSQEKKENPYLQAMANHLFDGKVHRIESIPLYWVVSDEPLTNEQKTFMAQEILVDPVTEIAIYQQTQTVFDSRSFGHLLEVSYRPGVTDNTAKAFLEAIEITNLVSQPVQVASGVLYLIEGDLTQEDLFRLGNEVLANPLLQTISCYRRDDFPGESRFNHYHYPQVKLSSHKVKNYPLDIADQELSRLSEKSLWALSLKEMKEIRDFYQQEEVKITRQKKGLPPWPTDVEMEVIAQTWSEHCKHKIFSSHIDYDEKCDEDNICLGSKKITSLFSDYIKKVTKDVKEKRDLDWLVSVFTDNAGIVRFDDKLDVCVKVETHNSPSALDPYGGAITGILGVNRDILGCGLGAKPVANTDVFCFAHPRLLENDSIRIPKGLKNPAHIFDGVHKGVEDGGNKSGIPTVNGAIHFDDNFAGKPLVYCGTVGVLPQKIMGKPTHLKGQSPGDAIVMVGGAIGADGIHGATFSSMELTEGAPATVVQIGDPITQKRVMDLLLEARDKGLYNGITDNGAGGLSSSIGEMAQECNGAQIDLQKARVKYPGLSPYELLISESQERMSLSVPQKNLQEFLALANNRGVYCDVLGKFNDSGYFSVYYGEELVAYLDLHFLHESLLPMNLKASWQGPQKKVYWHGLVKDSPKNKPSVKQALLELLKRPNIASKEKWVRQYDHEVQGATVIKPFTGRNGKGPSDGAVIWMAPHGGGDKNAIAIGSGLCPQYSHIDTYLMAQYAIDEAVRNIVASGGDPSRCALVDNFCWPDPITSQKNPDGEHKLAQLVRCCQGLYDTALCYGMPFVSGKDSMKNDFHGQFDNAKKVKISVPPTLLITAVAQVENVENVVTTDFKKSGDLIYLLSGANFKRLTYGEYAELYQQGNLLLDPIETKECFERYLKIYELMQDKMIASCHDVSDGGSLVAVAESMIDSSLGARINYKSTLQNNEKLEALMFNETAGSFILTVPLKHQKQFEATFSPHEYRLLGEVLSGDELIVDHESITRGQLIDAWSSL